MESIGQRIALVQRHIDSAAAAVDGDAGCSPVLRAVVGELAQKRGKSAAAPAAMDADPPAAREAAAELEQAADGANVAGKADGGAGAQTVQLIKVAHDTICMLKHEWPRASE